MSLKPKIVIYTTDSAGLEKGPKYANPYHFDAVHKDAAKVIVVGDWPKVVEAYKALGIPVKTVEFWPPRDHIVLQTEPAPPLNAGIAIPDGFELLPWADEDKTKTIRFLAQQFTPAVVINRKHASKIIRDELARRSGAA